MNWKIDLYPQKLKQTQGPDFTTQRNKPFSQEKTIGFSRKLLLNQQNSQTKAKQT